MFFSCSKLVSLPDISGWDTQNVKNMTGMFGDCGMLTSLPDLSKWTVNKKTLIMNMFKGCREDLEIPKKFRKVNDVDEGDKESQE
jgi:surface protein